MDIPYNYSKPCSNYTLIFRTSGSSAGALQRRKFTDEDIMVTLPNGVDACDIGTITVWCEPFKVIFAQLEVPRSTFVSETTANFIFFKF